MLVRERREVGWCAGCQALLGLVLLPSARFDLLLQLLYSREPLADFMVLGCIRVTFLWAKQTLVFLGCKESLQRLSGSELASAKRFELRGLALETKVSSGSKIQLTLFPVEVLDERSWQLKQVPPACVRCQSRSCHCCLPCSWALQLRDRLRLKSAHQVLRLNSDLFLNILFINGVGNSIKLLETSRVYRDLPIVTWLFKTA